MMLSSESGDEGRLHRVKSDFIMSTAQISSVQVEGNVEKSMGFSREMAADSGSRRTIVAVPLSEGAMVSRTVASITAIGGIIAEIHGPVTLEKLSITCHGSKAGDGVGFVLTRTGGATTDANYLLKPNARKMIYTDFNAGTMLEYDVPIPAGLAKQLSPVSGQFPGLDFFIKSYGAAIVVVFFELGIHGDRFVACEGF